MNRKDDLGDILNFLRAISGEHDEKSGSLSSKDDKQKFVSEEFDLEEDDDTSHFLPMYLFSCTTKELVVALIITLFMSDTISVQDFMEAMQFAKESKFE